MSVCLPFEEMELDYWDLMNMKDEPAQLWVMGVTIHEKEGQDILVLDIACKQLRYLRRGIGLSPRHKKMTPHVSVCSRFG